MNKHQMIILSVVCALVFVASALVLRHDPASTGEVITLGLDHVDTQAVSQVTRTDPTGTMSMQREGSAWTMDGAPVASTTVIAFLESLTGARITKVAEEGRTVPAYGFIARPLTISIVSGDEEVTLDVGGPGSALDAVYVAVPGGEAVYVLEGTTLGTLAHEDWRTWRSAADATTTPSIR